MRLVCWLVLTSIGAGMCALSTGAEPHQPDRHTLLLDSLDEAFTPDGSRCSRPAVITPAGEYTGGRPMKGGRFVPGRFGNTFEMEGLMNVVYPGTGNIDPSAGSLSFWVAHKFDAPAIQQNPPAELRNQLYATVLDRRRNRVVIYSTLKQTCVGVWDRRGQLVCYGGFPAGWKKDEWHRIELRWGRQLELWCDGVRQVANDWAGLFGPLDVNLDELSIFFGSHVRYSDVHSEFRLDEIRILGPGEGQTPWYPAMTVPRMAKPQIDGRLEESEWAGAARCDGFVVERSGAMIPELTSVYLGWDDDALYVAMDCGHPQDRQPVAKPHSRDSSVADEDAIGVFLLPAAAQAYYELTANAAAAMRDCRTRFNGALNRDAGFDPRWEVRTHQSPGRWTAEARIPFVEMDGRAAPKSGERWRANFCRTSPGSRSAWAYMAGDLRGPECFGELLFSDADRAIRLESLGDWADGKPSPRIAMTGLKFDPVVTVQAELIGSDTRTVAESQTRLTDYTSTVLSVPPLVTDLYTLVVRAATEEGPLFYRRLPFRVTRPFDISAEVYPYEGKLWITTNIGGMDHPPPGLTVRCRLAGQDGPVDSCEIGQFDRGIGKGSIEVDKLPAGKYSVKADATATDGRVLASAAVETEVFSKPAWWRSTAGVDQTVPKPWTPVAADEKTIRVWGRDYLGGGALPVQIVNQGSEMLAAPIRLALGVDGKTEDLAAVAMHLVEQRPDAVVRSGGVQAGAVEVKLRSTTEFDGMQRCDLTLSPAGECEVSGLCLEIPLKRVYAEFLLPSSGHTADARRLGDQPWASRFVPQVWLGNDDLGLAWFAESDEHWLPKDDRMVEVLPRGETVVLRCNILRSPLKLSVPATITFGLMATPVKPVPVGDPFWFRFGSLLGDINRLDDPGASRMPKESCRYPALGNLDPKQGTLEFWLSAPGLSRGPQREVLHVAGTGGGLSLNLTPGQTPRLTLTVTGGGKTAAVTATATPTTFDEFHHVAVTWSDQVALLVGGRRVGTAAVDLAGSLAADPDQCRIVLGCASDWKGHTQMAIDELRISDRVRYPDDTLSVPATAFKPDRHTLLLDHFDDVFTPDGEDAETAATVVSGKSGELGGVPSIGCRFVPGRFGQGLRIAVTDPVSSAEAMKQWGANAMLFWFWFEEGATKDGWPPPLFVEPPRGDYRAALRRLGELGVGVCPYMAYLGIGAPSPLSRQFGAEWARNPLSTSPAEPPKGHYYLDCCGASGFGDYLAAGSQWLLDDLGFHGCYTDGNARCYPCSNVHHGCGYRDAQGAVHPTFPVFATREYLKRMYKTIHARGDKGYLVNHVSYDMFIPTVSFTDVYYTGEHESYEDLVKCRVRWQAKPWGVWPILLGADSHSYTPLHMTYGLLHATSVWPQGALGRNDMQRKTANLWQTYDRFGYRDAQWIPYYRAEAGGLAKADREEVKVSLYRHPEGRALAVVGNLAHEVVTATVAFDAGQLGFQPKSARNALSGRPLPVAGGSCTVRLRPASFVLVWVE